MPTTVLASRYNTLRNNVNLILSESSAASPTYGYGQSFSTNSKIGTRTVADPVNAEKITAQDYEDLYIDLVRCRAHQVGAANVIIDDFVVGDYESNLTDTDKIEEAYINNLESLAATILTDRFNVPATNLDLENLPGASSSRAASPTWTTQISHIFTINWPTVENRRHFFNAGGEVRFSASVEYTGSQAKTVDWQTILNAMGSTSFKAEETVNNAAIGSGSNIGNYDLTNSYRLVYSRTGGAVYSRNRYYIYAKEYATGDNTSSIQFKIIFSDGRPNNLTYGIDEVVRGEFSSTVQLATPNSEVIINGTLYDAVSTNIQPTASLLRPLS